MCVCVIFVREKEGERERKEEGERERERGGVCERETKYYHRRRRCKEKIDKLDKMKGLKT